MKKVEKANIVEFDWSSMHEIYRGSDRRIFESCSIIIARFVFPARLLLFFVPFSRFFSPLQGVRNVKVCFFVFLSYTPGSRLYNYRLYISPLVITQRSTRSRACGKCIRKIDMCTFDRAFAWFFSPFPFFFSPLICLRLPIFSKIIINQYN